MISKKKKGCGPSKFILSVEINGIQSEIGVLGTLCWIPLNFRAVLILINMSMLT